MRRPDRVEFASTETLGSAEGQSGEPMLSAQSLPLPSPGRVEGYKMSRPQKNTVVRISLRSMLAITFGVAVVMAVAGPYLRALEPEKKWLLLYSFLLFGCGMICATVYAVWRRLKIGRRCGALLVPLKMHSSRYERWKRWHLLLITLPLLVFFSYLLFSSQQSDVFGQFISIFLPLQYGWIMANEGLSAWAEGYSDSVDLCGNGITTSSKFYAWSSPKLRDIQWGFANVQLEINLRWYTLKVPVPREQREAVDAILENYYRPNRLSKH